VGVKRLLGQNNGLHGVRSVREDHEEGVALRTELEAMVCRDCSPHQTTLVLEDITPLVTQFLEQTR